MPHSPATDRAPRPPEILHEQGLKGFHELQAAYACSVTDRSLATPHRSMVVTAIALTATLINSRANRSALNSGITGSMWCRPTLEVEHEQALRHQPCS